MNQSEVSDYSTHPLLGCMHHTRDTEVSAHPAGCVNKSEVSVLPAGCMSQSEVSTLN